MTVFGGFGCLAAAFLPAFLLVHLTAVRGVGGTDHYLFVAGAHREFVAALTELERRDPSAAARRLGPVRLLPPRGGA